MDIGDYVEIIQDEHPDPKTGEVLDIDDNSGYIFVMENNPSFHGKAPNEEQLAKALEELST